MGGVELVAAALGVACVYLIIRQSLWCWPVGIAMTALYAWIFFDVRLYSDFGLQIIYIGLQAYGWWFWVARRDAALAHDRAPIRTLGRTARLLWLFSGLTAAGALGLAMDRATNADLPYWDALTTSFSLVAQILLARKYLENWLVWIAVDILSIGIYLVKGLEVTAGLYAVFLAMAVWGFLVWWRDPARLAAGREAAG
ncbi:MAG: nicotinamide riboside transporter PnuC [Maricaulaceae bacterium]|nr:nicotinamide riboside transporter PnuC [Maricaulaceae bacterium]